MDQGQHSRQRTIDPATSPRSGRPDCCEEGSSRMTRRRQFPSFEGLGSSEPVDSPPAARKLERRRGRLPTISRLSKPGAPVKKKQVHELCEKSVHFQSLHTAVCRQAAPVAEFADRCRIHLQGLASQRFCFQCTKTFGFHWHDFRPSFNSWHPSTSASLQDTSATHGFLLLVAAAHKPAAPCDSRPPPPNASKALCGSA